MNDLSSIDKLVSSLKEASELEKLIKEAENNCLICDIESDNQIDPKVHADCFVNNIPRCFYAINNLLINLIATNPSIIDDRVKKALSHYYSKFSIKAQNLILHEYLLLLISSKTQLLTWLKFENLLVHLIKERFYEPKTLVSEVLSIVHKDLSPDLASKFSSTISSCSKHCKDLNDGCHNSEEEEEKWCEIMEWVSWFLASEDEGFG